MRTRRERAVALFGGGGYSAGGMSGPSASVERGTLAADTWTDEETGKLRASILVDGDEVPGDYGVEVEMPQGQRVLILYFSSQAYVLPVSGCLLGMANDYADAGDAAVVEQSKQAAIEATGEQIQQEVAEEVGPLYDEFDEFKASHTLTDEQITSQITDAVETAEEAYSATTTLTQTVDTIQSTATEKYEQYDAGMVSLQSQVTQNANAITTEVSDRAEAVSGALSEAKSYTNQTADGLEQSFANTYQTKEGMSSYATTAYVDSTSEAIEQTFTKSLNAKGKTYIGQPSPPYYEGDVWIDAENGIAYTCVKGRESGSYTASDWTASDDFVSAFIKNDVNGITVGRDSLTYKARVSSLGEFQILEDDDVFFSIGQKYGETWLKTFNTTIAIVNSTGTSVSLGNDSLSLDAVGYVRVGNTAINSAVPSYASFGYRGVSLGCATLYSNTSGTQGSFSLSAEAGRYPILEFVYGDGTRYITKRVYSPNGKSVSLDRSVYNASMETYFMSVNVYSISGTAVSIVGNTGQAVITSSSTHVDNSAQLYVYQVIGWR